MNVQVREHPAGTAVSDFMRAGHEVFRGDPAWVPPLEMELRERLSPKHNPFFGHGEATYFTAWQQGQLVGRCSAQIDREHLRIHKDGAGFFGFFDTINDAGVARALLDEASQWLRARGMERIRGPFSLSINEEPGMLVEGFEHPPFIMMPHSRPYQQSLTEQAGFSKAKDLLAWRYEASNIPSRLTKAWETVRDLPEVRIRSVDRSHMKRDLDIVMDIYNDSWGDNWGFVPATPAEVSKTAKDLRLVIDEDLSFIAEIHGKPAAVCVCLPNLNEAIRDLGGKLGPAGLAKLLWRMKVRRPSSARLMMLGITKEFRGNKRYGGLSSAMYVELHRRGVRKGYMWGELSWTLEDNHPVNLGIRAMGGKVYKRYRIFEKPLVEGAQRAEDAKEVGS